MNLKIEYEVCKYQIYNNETFVVEAFTFDGVLNSLQQYILESNPQKEIKLNCKEVFPDKETKKLESLINVHNALISLKTN